MSRTFSESWHRVAGARLGLLPTVAVHKQRFRGQYWYVLRDTYTQRFFRISPQAYAFVSRLDAQSTVEQVWEACLEAMPSQAPGQEEVMQVLSQLHQSNLLFYDTPPDSQTIFRRYQDHRRREVQSKLLGFLSIRIPLWDPDRWLDRHTAFTWMLVSWPTALLVLLLLLSGGAAALSQVEQLWGRTEGLFSPSNLPLLYGCIAVMKALHELGHAHVVKRFGGQVHAFGVMLLMGMPLPYVDATGSWSFRDRWARALVGAAGIIVELVLAAMGALVWVNSGPGLVNSLAFNVMIVGSVSSLVFNGNPLLRFDAYYVLSDILEIPNLYQRSGEQWTYLASRWLLGLKKVESPARDPREWWWLTGYGLTSFVYRMLVFSAMLLVLADTWLPLVIVFMATTLVMAVLMPLWKWISYLRSPALVRHRLRAIGVSIAALLLPLILLGWLPFPDAIRAPGVVQSVEFTQVAVGMAGRLDELLVTHGQQVVTGQVLLRMSNPELELERVATQAQFTEIEVLRNQALGKAPAEVPSLDKRLQATGQRLALLQDRHDELTVRAKHGGTWSAPAVHEELHSWVPRGHVLGEISNPDALRFSAVVSQEQANELFAQNLQEAELRLQGQAGEVIVPRQLVLVPYQHDRLQSSALGWHAGGTVAVKPDDPEGMQTLDSFYELQALFEVSGRPVVALHGMTGWVRIPLPAQPLLLQWHRSLQQLLQKRYRL
jgi:putative peptide zinc metalloprotease protein